MSKSLPRGASLGGSGELCMRRLPFSTVKYGFGQPEDAEPVSHPDLFKETALFVTFAEGGGYWDSGFIQPLDFFGDGPRIPMLVVSPFSRGGKIVHSYNDHASVVKFIERNWDLKPLTDRS